MNRYRSKILNRNSYKQSPVLIDGTITHELTDNQHYEKENKKKAVPSEIDLNIKGGMFIPKQTYKTLKQIGEENGVPKFGKLLKKYYCIFFFFKKNHFFFHKNTMDQMINSFDEFMGLKTPQQNSAEHDHSEQLPSADKTPEQSSPKRRTRSKRTSGPSTARVKRNTNTKTAQFRGKTNNGRLTKDELIINHKNKMEKIKLKQKKKITKKTKKTINRLLKQVLPIMANPSLIENQ